MIYRAIVLSFASIVILILVCIRYQEAEPIARQVVARTTELKGATHEMTAVAQLNLASACGCIGAYQADTDSARWANEALELLAQAEKTLRTTLGNDNGYVEAVIENRAQVYRLLKKPESEIARERSQHEATRREIEIAPPTELPHELVEKYQPQWQTRAAPQRSCDPRGFMLEPEVLQLELREFTKVWRAAGKPWNSDLAPVIHAWNDAITDAQQTLARAADEEKMIIDATRDAVKAAESDPKQQELIARLKEMRDNKLPMTAEERALAEELLVEKTPIEKAREQLPNVMFANYVAAGPARAQLYQQQRHQQQQQQ